VTADPAHLRFFVDETSLGLGKALAIARRDTVHVGHPLVPEAPVGSFDEEWIPAVAARGLIVLGRDRHIRTRPGERELILAHGLRVFRIHGKRDLRTWDYLVRLVRRWNDVESILNERGGGPWFMAIRDRDVVELPL
jgi:hypothetical protein